MTFKIVILTFSAIAIFALVLLGVVLTTISVKSRNNATDGNDENKENYDYNNDNVKRKGIINKMNYNSFINHIGKKMPQSNLEKIFNRAKNPWRMTIPTFQFIRFGGLFISLILAACLLPIGYQPSLFALAIGILFVWYPIYYYKAIGDEREAEWNKMYEFIWVIKHNIMLYDPAKSFINTKIYLEEHAPHNKELIAGFQDFYNHWNPDYIDDYIERYYPFSVSREIYQIIFNMNKTGDFPQDQLNSLRSFIINAQNLTVEKTLSSVSGKATIYSLPFLMMSVIVALMVPMVMQILQFM